MQASPKSSQSAGCHPERQFLARGLASLLPDLVEAGERTVGQGALA